MRPDWIILALIEVARRWKRQWFGHTTRRPGSLAHDGLVDGASGRVRLKRTWLTDIAGWKVQAGEEG